MGRISEAFRNAVGIIAIWIVVFGLAIYVESGQVLESIVVPLPGTPVPVWISEFRFMASVTLWITLAFIATWYIPASMYSMNSWENTQGKRWHWSISGVLAVITAFAAGVLMMPQAQSGGELAYLFLALNSGLFYYFSTALFSPYSFKYIAFGARHVRPRRL